jgi:hypothetical protein
MLSDRARIILFWVTIGLMVVIAIGAATTILRACGVLGAKEPPPEITPTEINLCPGEQRQFSLESDIDVTWEAGGGTITENGLFTAGDTPGEYTVIAVPEGRQEEAEAIVHIVDCTPTPEPTPTPTAEPTVAATATPTPEADEPVEGTDAQDDIVYYDNGEPASAPAGIDIQAANINMEREVTLQPTENMPEALSDFAGEGDILLWLSLYEPIPDQPPAYTNWLFALDVDGNPETGRQPGQAQINPDLGDEVAVGISYNPETGAFEPYTLVWNEAQGDWVAGPEARYQIDETRTVMGLALSLEDLRGALTEAEAATSLEGVKGRAAAETYVVVDEEVRRVIDFYPDRPE